MHDHIDCLCEYFTETCLPKVGKSRDILYQERLTAEALATLEETFSAAQRKLYLRYEAAQNALLALEERRFFRHALRFGRELYF